MYTGNSVKKVDADKERQSQMNFVEVTVLLCLLANEFSKKVNADEMHLKPPVDKIKELFAIVMTAFHTKVEEVPPKDQDLRGLVIPEDILVDGRIEKVRPPTPEDERESYYPDMFSCEHSDASND